MKFTKTATPILVCGLLASTTAIFTEKAYAGAADNSTAAFSGTVIPSCTTTTQFSPTRTYTNGVLGPSGGVKTLTRASTTATFDCNSDTVTVGAIVSVTQPPTPSHATAIVGIHQASVAVDPGGEGLNGATGDLGTVTAVTDPNGDVTVQVISRWDGGEDLLDGNYTASFVVSVTAD
jgi:hypothetical protein